MIVVKKAKKYVVTLIVMSLVVSAMSVCAMDDGNGKESALELYQDRELLAVEQQSALNAELLAIVDVAGNKKGWVIARGGNDIQLNGQCLISVGHGEQQKMRERSNEQSQVSSDCINDQEVGEQRIERLKKLIDLKAAVNCQNRAGDTPLMIACRCDCIEMVRILLEAGAYIDQSCDLVNPLMMASQLGNGEMVKILCAAGATVRACNKYGWTALSRALFWGRPDVMRELLYAGSSIDWVDSQGNTLLHLATGDDVARMLIWAGARPDVPNEIGRTVLDFVGKKRIALMKCAGKERELSILACGLLMSNPQLLVKKEQSEKAANVVASEMECTEDVPMLTVTTPSGIAAEQSFARNPLMPETRYIPQSIMSSICEYVTVPFSEFDRARWMREAKQARIVDVEIKKVETRDGKRRRVLV